MAAWTVVPLLMVVLLQSGWTLTQAPPREVRRLYWELIPEMEVWVRLVPENPDGKPTAINLVFHAFYPGRAQRDWFTGLPAWPKGAPTRLTVSAESSPLVLVRELTLRFAVDGRMIDLTGPTSRYRQLPCPIASEDCSPNGVEAELDASTLRSLTASASIGGQALGLPIRLTAADQHALGEFAARTGLSGDEAQKP